MRKFLCLLPSLLLFGCYSDEQLATARQMQIDEDNRTCVSYGYRVGSEAFANCRLELDILRQQRADYYYNQPPRFYSGYYYRRW